MSDDYVANDDLASSSTWSSTEGISAYFVLFSTLLTLVLVLSKFLHGSKYLRQFLPEAGLILLVGMLGGCIIHWFVPQDRFYEQEQAANGVARSLLSFSPNAFFVALLPPIIFNSGYHLRRELFFRHIYSIVLFAIVGTVISTLCTAFFLHGVVHAGLTGDFVPHMAELLTFGALISATDPVSTLAVFSSKRVDPHLFYLVFGESVLNDAVGLLLFKAFAQFVTIHNGAGKIIFSFTEFIVSFGLDALLSPILGVACGVAAAVLFKHVDLRRHRLLELSVYVLIMYWPFLLAELVHLSGIVTILFTGMVARHFVVPNLSQATALTAESLFRLAAHLAETAIFLELGLSVFGLTLSSTAHQFAAWAILACLLARAVNVYPLTLFYNQTLRQPPQATASQQTHEQQLDGTTAIDVDDPERTPRRDNAGVLQSKHKDVSSAQIEMTQSLAKSDHHRPPTPRGAIPLKRTDTDLSSITPRQVRDMKILPKTAHMLWFSGLRGAVAYACVRSFPNTFGHANEFILTTMVVVLATVFVLGGTTECALSVLNIDTFVDEDKYMEEWHQQRKQNSFILRIEDFVNRIAVRAPEEPSQHATSYSVRQDDSYAHHHHHTVEISESLHFDNPEDSVRGRKESLFDYGGEFDE